MGAEIGLVLRERLVDLRARCPFDVADVGEPFGAQQRLGDVLRSAADARVLFQPHGPGFEWSLFGECCWRGDEARGAGQRKHGQKLPPRLGDPHWRASLTLTFPSSARLGHPEHPIVAEAPVFVAQIPSVCPKVEFRRNSQILDWVRVAGAPFTIGGSPVFRRKVWGSLARRRGPVYGCCSGGSDGTTAVEPNLSVRGQGWEGPESAQPRRSRAFRQRSLTIRFADLRQRALPTRAFEFTTPWQVA